MGGNLPDVDMCPLHLSQGGSTILMLSSVILKGYELLAYTTTGALGTGFRYSYPTLYMSHHLAMATPLILRQIRFQSLRAFKHKSMHG